MRSTNLIRTAKTGYIVLSLALCALGLLLMLRPDLSITAIGIIVGCVLIAFGAVKLIGYFSKDLYRLAFQFDLAFGLLLLALGVAVLLRPDRAMSTLCVILGVEIVADGLFKIQTALDARRFGLGSWWLILTLAVLAGAIGVMMIVSPSEGALALAMLLGASLLAEGALNLGVALCAVKIISHQIDGPEPRFHLRERRME
ncbi:MAG: DUF308 domain-containing protein [Clostridia bacterium]|nr:DUF308 domain-containing protein [Clostridia bacterium]